MYIIIAGGGQVGSYLARRLIENNKDVAVIDTNKSICDDLSEWGKPLVIYGDCTDINVLIDAGIDHADCVASMSGDDAVNLITCQIAKNRFNTKLTVSRINNPNNEPIFKKMGVDFSLNTTEILASAIQEGILVENLIPLAAIGKGKATLVEISLSEKSQAAGMAVSGLKLPKGSVLCAILRTEDIIFPHGDTMLYAGDTVISLVSKEAIEDFRRVFRP